MRYMNERSIVFIGTEGLPVYECTDNFSASQSGYHISADEINLLPKRRFLTVYRKEFRISVS